MCSYISKIENTEGLNTSKTNNQYDSCDDDEKWKWKRGAIAKSSGIEEASTLHTHERFPPLLSITNEYAMEFHNLANSKSETKRRRESDDHSSSDVFRKRGATNSITISLVVFFDQMINKRQLTIAIISCICSIYALYIALSRNLSVYGYESRHQSAHTIKNVLLLYGLAQLLLSVIFFCTYAATKIDRSKWRCQIIRFIGCATYLLVAFFVLLVGLVGFYWVVKLYGHVEYEDRQSVDYVDMVLYNSSFFTFSFHICFALLKCCWWN
ncbi:unnamed protein product [Litomosoides sigmodontis]|uniref:Uncharacterized protein n=1 Tax=Litomosoides sigmodontis TaxID=42156 RepID=A0A3P6THH1_LITSI|nr:unnamed protein product [Litomosoides sigmodontis]